MIDTAAAIQPADQVIVVTGRGLETDEKLIASVILDRADIDRSASGRMEDVLRGIAGLASFRRSDSRSAHPTSQGLTLRGLGGNAASRVLVSLDGVPQADPFGGWIGFAALDPHAIDQIRVTRGGGGGLAGPGAVAGTIDIDSSAVETRGLLDGLVSAGFRRSLDARLLAGTRWGDGFASVSGSFARGDGFVPVVVADRGAADQRAPHRHGSGRARLVQPVGRSIEAQLSLSTYTDRRTRGTDESDNRQRGTDASLRLVGGGRTRWSVVAYAQRRRFDSEFASVNDERSAASKVLDQQVPARGWGARAEVAPKAGPVELRLGADWRLVSGETKEDFRFISGAPTRHREAGGRSVTTGLFGAASWSRGGWSLGVEIRADRWRIEDGGLLEREIGGAILTDNRFDSRSGWEGSGRIALGRALGEAVALRVAAYRGWRLPTLNELYRPFRVGADATAANAALDPERLRGIEAGLDWTPARSMKLSATAFANRLEDAVANVTLGQGPGSFPGVGFVAGTFRQRRNVDAIVSRGVEVDGNWARGPWRVTLSYALTDARMEAGGPAASLDGKRPAQVARHAGSASLGWARSGIDLSAGALLTGRQFDDDGNSRALPAALTFDAAARVAVTRRVAIELRAENPLDKQVVASIGGDGTRERAQPRTLWIGLRLR